MKPYPHTYTASAEGTGIGFVAVTTEQLPPLDTASPPEFDGPEGVWSPETLLCASVVDCFILTFRGVARAARFEWLEGLRTQARMAGGKAASCRPAPYFLVLRRLAAGTYDGRAEMA